MRSRSALALAAMVSVTVATLVAPASAQPDRPGVPFVTASTPDSVTLRWSSTGADRYRVTFSRSATRAVSSSAAHRTTPGPTTSMTVTGLRAGTRYCFSVRAVRGDRTHRPSSSHCHWTMRRPNRTSQPTASVMTFNVCGSPRGCASWRRWPKRRAAVLQRIDAARADVVALQEVDEKVTKLGPDLARRGFARSGRSRDEVVHYRVSRFDSVAGRSGSRRLPHGKTFAWTTLRDRQTNQQLVVVSVHLSYGRSGAAARVRGSQTSSLIKQVRRIAQGRPVVLAGDFNSDLTFADDTVGTRLQRAGYRDAYQGSATYVRPYLNSFNGYDRTPARNARWGGHIDRVFTLGDFGATDWAVVARTSRGRYVGRWASDHNPVRVTLYLP